MKGKDQYNAVYEKRYARMHSCIHRLSENFQAYFSIVTILGSAMNSGPFRFPMTL